MDAHGVHVSVIIEPTTLPSNSSPTTHPTANQDLQPSSRHHHTRGTKSVSASRNYQYEVSVTPADMQEPDKRGQFPRRECRGSD